jgi:hypothetical protein
MSERESAADLRLRLVEVALVWQERSGVAPAVTSALSELDAALLVGMTEDEYCSDCASRTAVTRGCDFAHHGCRYQVEANRPSGRRGSFVTLVGRANNYEWDKLVWILYDRGYVVQEAWEWDVDEYRSRFETWAGCPQLTCARAGGSSPRLKRFSENGRVLYQRNTQRSSSATERRQMDADCGAGISAHDPLTYLCAIALMAAVAFVACWVPARRAIKLDPLLALRAE